jgi:hypothetical protein
VQVGDVGELAAKTVERFDHDYVKKIATEIGAEFLVPGSEAAGATDRVVFVAAHQSPALPFDKPPADFDLVLDRGIPLVLAAIAGVDDGAHHSYLLGEDHIADYDHGASMLRMMPALIISRTASAAISCAHSCRRFGGSVTGLAFRSIRCATITFLMISPAGPTSACLRKGSIILSGMSVLPVA